MDAVEAIATQVTAGPDRDVHDLKGRTFDASVGWKYRTLCNRILIGQKAMRTTRESTCEECLDIRRPIRRRGRK